MELTSLASSCASTVPQPGASGTQNNPCCDNILHALLVHPYSSTGRLTHCSWRVLFLGEKCPDIEGYNFALRTRIRPDELPYIYFSNPVSGCFLFLGTIRENGDLVPVQLSRF